jgi:hypothetical protein
MRKLLLIGLGFCAVGAMWRREQEDEEVFFTPFVAALALEAGMFLLRHHQGSLLNAANRIQRR